MKQKLINAIEIVLNYSDPENITIALEDVRNELRKYPWFALESIVYRPFFSLLESYEVQSDEQWLKSLKDSLQGVEPYWRSHVFQYEFDKHIDSKWEETLSSARILHKFVLDNLGSDLRQFEQYRELHRMAQRLFSSMEEVKTLPELIIATLAQTLILLPVNGSDSNVISHTSYNSTLPSKEMKIVTSERLQRANKLDKQLAGKLPFYLDVHFTEFAYILNIS